MSTEVRVILFDETEVFTALIALRRRTRRALPIGSVERITMSPRGGATLFVEVVDTDEKRHHLRFESVEIAAALIADCIDKRVLMPRTAERRVEVMNGRVGLVISRKEIWAEAQTNVGISADAHVSAEAAVDVTGRIRGGRLSSLKK